MPRRWQNQTTAPSLGNGEQIQGQSTASGALRATHGDADVATVTFTLDTSAYASADLVADTQVISTTLFDQNAGSIILDSITLLDEDDQKVALYFVFIQDSTSLGTENSAPNISDANARKVVGVVPVATGDYLDIGGCSVACVRNIGLTMKAAASSRALYVAIVNAAGTPTYTATGLQGMFAFRQV